jgi:CubicO group peptidase (beta-lactamase class C family)
MVARASVPLLLAAAALAQDPARMDQVVQSYVANKSFMGSVLVARDGQVLFSKGYGMANLEWGVPNSPSTKFRIGSVTKQFTAAAILLLEERGKLKTDDPVKKFMPDAPPAWDRITIFHLLTHTSGLPNFTSFPDYRAQEPFAATPEKLVARFRDKPLEFSRERSGITATRAMSCSVTCSRRPRAKTMRRSCKKTFSRRWACAIPATTRTSP